MSRVEMPVGGRTRKFSVDSLGSTHHDSAGSRSRSGSEDFYQRKQ